MDDDKIWQKRGAKFEDEAGEHGEGQKHTKAPEQVTAIQDKGQEDVLGGKEKRGKKPGDPAIPELDFEARHAVAKVCGQFCKPDRERKEKTYKECPSRQRTEQHVGGGRGIAEDRGSEGFARRCGNGQTNEDQAKEPEQIRFPGRAGKSEDVPVAFSFDLESLHKQKQGCEIGKECHKRPPASRVFPGGRVASCHQDQCDQSLKKQEQDGA